MPPTAFESPVVSGNVTGPAALCPDQASIPPTCGVQVSGQVASCAGNQTCLCDLNLCATFERTDDCPTGWRRAVDGACLDLTDVNPNLRPSSDGLCPGARLPSPQIQCGRPNQVGLIEDCPEDQTCICGTNRCAIADATACPATRFRYAPEAPGADAECVAVDDANGERIIEGACTEFRPAPIACGTEETGPDCPDPNQRCVCATGLCAEAAPAPTCAQTGLRYVGSGECVAENQQPTVIDDGLCAPACGVAAADGRIVQCPFGNCICTDAGGRCAVTDATCPTTTAFVDTNICLAYTASAAAQTLTTGAVCPAVFEDRACGGPSSDGRLARCAAGETCVCEGGVGRCARAEATCPAGRAFAPTNRCAPGDGGAITSVVGLLCPGATAAPPLSCGELDGTGRIRTCRPDEQCICRAGGGTCAAAEPACPFGFANANDGACVALSDTDFTRPVAADALCPPLAPTPIACGVAAETECAGELRCGCSGSQTGVCVIEQAACPSGLAEAATLRCIRLDENLQVIETGACTP